MAKKQASQVLILCLPHMALASLPVLSGPQLPIHQMDRQSWRSL